MALLKKMKLNGQLPAFERFKSFDYDDLTAKHCYFECSKPPDVDGIKIFNEDNQTAKHCSCHLNVLWPGHLVLSNILIPSPSRGLEHPIAK